MENLFLRECYKTKGLGRMLLSVVAKQALKMGCKRVKWVMLDWNVLTIKFYEKMGANFIEGYRFFSLIEEALQAYGGPN